jgi:hypothetical protein
MARDLEVSTFQKRPAYRYIRKSDKMPPLAEGDGDGMARVKLFNPTGAGTWYLSEYDPETRRAFGVAIIQEREYGYIDMAELVAFRGRMGLPIERDLYWTPRPLAECTD